jgi:hypothetical protein
MNLRNRLKRLEQNAGAGGCPACRDRRAIDVLVSAEQLPDGTTVPIEPLPPPCERCGEVPELVVLVVEEIVDVDDDGRATAGIPQKR